MLRIAILSPKPFDQAESFIRNHIEHLPFDSIVIHGDNFPYKEESIGPSELDLKQYAVIRFIRRIFGLKTKSAREIWLERILTKKKIDLVFAEYLVTAAEALPVCKKLKVPIITIALGYEISQYDVVELYKEKYKALFNYVSSIVVVAEHMATKLIELGCPKELIVFSPIGPVNKFFDLRPNYENKTILAIGRFVGKKAPHLTIEAFNLVRKDIPDARLVMAGDGPLFEECKQLVKSLGIQNDVKFLGRISVDQQMQLFEDAYMFVQHSRISDEGDSEGTPVVILEASAAGLPVVSTIHAGIPKVVMDGKTGYLAKENDVESMALKMIDLLNNKDLASAFGSSGRDFVRSNFSFDIHIKKLAELIRKEITEE